MYSTEIPKIIFLKSWCQMKKGIHPVYNLVTATCVCGNSVALGSTKAQIRVEICGNCHPFYTGQQKIVDSEGRIERFEKRYSSSKH
jgi:large subunit ribosomal protein L31